MKFSEFKTDTSLEKEGVWHDIGMNDDGSPVRIKIARLGNPSWLKAYNKIPAPLRDGAQKGSLAGAMEKSYETLAAKCMAEHVLLGWEGFTDDDGNPVPYTVETAAAILADPEQRPFRSIVTQYAQDDAAFRAQAVAEKGKGSRGSSK